jgi:hypothetical protein
MMTDTRDEQIQGLFEDLEDRVLIFANLRAKYRGMTLSWVRGMP